MEDDFDELIQGMRNPPAAPRDDFDFRNIIHILLEEKEELESDYERVNKSGFSVASIQLEARLMELNRIIEQVSAIKSIKVILDELA